MSEASTASVGAITTPEQQCRDQVHPEQHVSGGSRQAHRREQGQCCQPHRYAPEVPLERHPQPQSRAEQGHQQHDLADGLDETAILHHVRLEQVQGPPRPGQNTNSEADENRIRRPARERSRF